MKTTRRQDLKTNELSQQIEQFRAYAKEHVGRLIAIGVVIVAGCASNSEMTTTDIDWRPQMLERNHQHTGSCCRYLPLTRENR